MIYLKIKRFKYKYFYNNKNKYFLTQTNIDERAAKTKMAAIEFRRKLYKRGSSYETTVPMPLLFALDLNKKNNVVFSFDPNANRWILKFEERKEQKIEQKVV